ncbi:hypothetical protein Vadar_000882 [Vaccinium darrowii]|uniref:Uncharacterized protein n=1 Tax=Vaccinium darrowii TaxID=229202 RepID=A0ACB7XW82_9ERIC|nr:hypothetical protein Vadar_000882 [Vaccinium darrowii]
MDARRHRRGIGDTMKLAHSTDRKGKMKAILQEAHEDIEEADKEYEVVEEDDANKEDPHREGIVKEQEENIILKEEPCERGRDVPKGDSLSRSILVRARELFVMAREHAPSIIFIAEIDNIGSARMESGSGSVDSEVQRTMLELLNQLDGFEAFNKIKILIS